MFNIIILGIASFLTDVSTEMVYPLLPLYLTSARIGASPAIVGLIEGMAESVASLLRVFSGAWSDRIQKRKPIAILGYASSTLGKVLLYLSTAWMGVLAGRLADRLGKGIEGWEIGFPRDLDDDRREFVPACKPFSGVCGPFVLVMLLDRIGFPARLPVYDTDGGISAGGLRKNPPVAPSAGH